MTVEQADQIILQNNTMIDLQQRILAGISQIYDFMHTPLFGVIVGIFAVGMIRFVWRRG